MRRLLAILLCAVLLYTLALGVYAEQATETQETTQSADTSGNETVTPEEKVEETGQQVEAPPASTPTEDKAEADEQQSTIPSTDESGEENNTEETGGNATEAPEADANDSTGDGDESVGDETLPPEGSEATPGDETGTPEGPEVTPGEESDPSDDAETNTPEGDEGTVPDDGETAPDAGDNAPGEDGEMPGDDGDVPGDDGDVPDDDAAKNPEDNTTTEDELDAEDTEDDVAAEEATEAPAETISFAEPTISISSAYSYGTTHCPPVTVTINAPGTIQSITGVDGAPGVGSTSATITLQKIANYTITVTDRQNKTTQRTITVGHGKTKNGSASTTEATCTKPGTKQYPLYCAVCGAFILNLREEKTEDALGHDFQVKSYTVDQCGGHGTVTVQTCTRCGLTNTDGGDLGSLQNHTFETRETAPTCMKPGLSYEECTKCQYKRNYTEIPATGEHTFTEWTMDQPYSCTEQGTEKSSCTVCHQQFTRPAGGAGHDWEEESVTYTDCTSPGVRHLKCRICEETQDQEVAVQGHKFTKDVIDTEPTCEAVGKKHTVCERCNEPKRVNGEIQYFDISKTPHDESGQWQHDSSNHYKICPVCRHQINYGSHVAGEASTDCTQPRTCKVCQYAMGSANASHNLVYDINDTTHTLHCQNAGCTYSVQGEAHKMSGGDPTDCTVPSVCSVCGYKVDGFSRHEADADAPWVIDGNRHWKKCKNSPTCEGKVDAAYHSPNQDDGNCMTAVTCRVCGQESTPAQSEHKFGKPSHSDGKYSTVYCQNNRCTASQQIEHTMVETSRTTKQERNCTQEGIVEVIEQCSGCGHIETREERTPATGHNMGDWETTTDSSCQSGGIQTRSCQNEGCTYTETQGLEAASHQFAEPVVTPATCEEDGLSSRTCSVCGFVEKTELPRLGHDYKVESTTPATCEDKAINHMKCSRCGHQYDEPSEAPALGHDFQEYVSNSDATCTKNGTESAKCSRCDAKDTRDIPNSATGHQYTSDHDCTTADKCLICGQPGSAASAHAPSGEWKVDAVTGEHYKECTNEDCNQRLLKNKHIPEVDDDDCTTALSCSVCGTVLTAGTGAHHFTAWVSAGVNSHTRSCQNAGCNVVETVAHTEGEVRTEGEEASCTTPGKVTHRYYCADCGAIYKEETIESEALDHDFTDWEVLESPDCNNSGAQKRQCKRCGYVEEQNVDPMGHDWEKNYTIDIEPTCETDGSRSIHCSKPNCSATMDSQVIPARGHDFQRDKLITPATCTSPAVEEVVCVDCGASIERESTLEADKALGHDFSNYVSDNNGTCVDPGTETATCPRCGALDTRTAEGITVSHQFVSDLDCTTPDVCAICGAMGEAQAAHDHSGAWEYDGNEHYKICANPDCSQRILGEPHVPEADDQNCTTGVKCAVCGIVLSEGMEAHSMGNWVHTDGTHTRYCQNEACTYSESEPHDEVAVREQVVKTPNCTEAGHTIIITYCSVCEAIVSQEDLYPAATGHKFGPETNVSSPDCDDGGSTQRVCEYCGYTETTVGNPAGHDWDTVYTTDRAPTCTEEGSESIHCRRPGCAVTKDTRVIEALGHDFAANEVVREATCVEPEVVQAKCTRCGETVTASNGEPLGHDFVTYVSDNNSTCLEPGTETATCTRCDATDTRTVEGGTLPHQFVSDFDCTTPDECAICGTLSEANSAHTMSDEWEQDGNYHFKSCVNEGCEQRLHFEEHVPAPDDDNCTTPVACTVCGITVTAATESHNMGTWIHTNDTHTRYCLNDACTYSESVAHNETEVEEQVITAPTCTTDGHTIVITYCADCEAILSQEDHYPAATGHKFGPETNVSSPDCDDAGSTQRVCEYCGYTETTVLNPSGHDWDTTYTTDKAPTCTEEGSESIHCRRPGCTATKDARVVEALGHDFAADEVVREATCVEPEVVQAKCTRCGETVTASNGEPLGHDFANYTSNNDATCTADGNETATCTRCDATDTRTAPGSALGHIVDPDAEPRIVPPTCTEEGQTFTTCERCGEEFLQSTQKPTGHKAVKEADLAATCTQSGYIGATTCSVCGAVLNAREEIPALGHTPVKEADLAATCTQAGYTGATSCSVCGAVLNARKEIPALGHTPVKEADLAPTCTQAGYTGATSCSVCGIELTARVAKPALGHSYGAWTVKSKGSHSSKCTRCGNERTQACSYSEMHVGGATVDVCKICGDVVDSGQTTSNTFKVIENVKVEVIDPDAMPAGELVVRELDVPFGNDIEVLEAFTVACELDGEELALNGKVRVTMPLVCDEPFLLYRVDEVVNPETGESEDQMVELEYVYENGEISFETDVNGLFLIVPEGAMEETVAA